MPNTAASGRTFRIGVQTAPYGPYWVQVQEAISEYASASGLALISIELPDQSAALSEEEQDRAVQELIAQDLDAFICINLSDSLVHRILNSGLPAVYLDESEIRHPLFISSYGLYEAARLVIRYLKEKLTGPSRVLCVGGNAGVKNDPAFSRITGIKDELAGSQHISIEYIPSPWIYEQAYPQLIKTLPVFTTPFDAVFGLSDSLALAARDACRSLGLMNPQTLVVGINSDPFALAAMAEGSMNATVDIHAANYGRLAVDLACQAARHEPLPALIQYEVALVTMNNLDQVARQKLIDIANLPKRLVGVRREQEQTRLVQMEISTAINRRVGALLNRQQLTHEIVDLIRANYGYDRVNFYFWSDSTQSLYQEGANQVELSIEQAGLLAEALDRNEPIFIPDTRHSLRFQPDQSSPETRSRVILPVHIGKKLLGVLDLHSYRQTVHLHYELIGLQSLADQLGIAMSNADLYSEALQSRAEAEKANQLKTRLLANVGHELRTPTNTILGYSQTMLNVPNLYQVDLPANLRYDLEQIYHSGEHLARLINDLLDLSRAEIGELDLFPETIPTRSFIEELFHSAADTIPLQGDIKWRLSLPERLPMIQADPIRLRQIVMNLLHNASKFTSSGEIVLGAEVVPPNLHLWVKDSGVGISAELQERIFEPFFTIDQPNRRRQGIGLGLSITRRLVALHSGSMFLESTPGQGSIFNVYLPLPNLAGQLARPVNTDQPVLLVISSGDPGLAPFTELSQRLGWQTRLISSDTHLEILLQEIQPAALGLDLTTARPGDWKLIEMLHRHPRFSQLPFILYGREAGNDLGLTSVFTKPISGKTFIDTLNAIRPATSEGPILVIEDDAQTRGFYQRLLAEGLPNSRVIYAENGAQALAILEHEVPCLVLLDLIMPEVDGFSVLERMRANHLTRQVPVLVLSGHSLTEEDVRRLDYANVTFHSKGLLSPEEAIEGFQKALSGQMALPQPTSTLVKHVLAYFHQNYQSPLSRQQVASAVGVSEDYLSRIFHKEMGLSPWECLNRHRILKARELLTQTSKSITEIAAEVGFEDSAYFSRVFRQYSGQSPKSYRQH